MDEITAKCDSAEQNKYMLDKAWTHFKYFENVSVANPNEIDKFEI